MKQYKIAVCQMLITNVKRKNIEKARMLVKEASENGAKIIVLPEMFNCPYDHQYFRPFAENEEGETVKALADMAKNNNIYLVGGSIPEVEGEEIYNTCFVFNPKGEIIGKHRKIHLFDIDVKGGVAFQESATLSAGNQVTIIETEYGKIGVAICYDIRFVELSRIMALEGAEIIVLPAAFNMTTGPAHWELSIRMRALDNQVYFVGAAPARDENADYVAYGYSTIASPWGDIVSQTEEKECILYGLIDREKIQLVRQELPLLEHRKVDLYRLEYEKI